MTIRPQAYILVAPPCAGKTTWRRSYLKDNHAVVASRDDIRISCFPSPYKFSKQNEEEVSRLETMIIHEAIIKSNNVIIDATHCKVSYLEKALKRFEGTDYEVTIIFLKIPFWKQRWRNFWRYIGTKIWIPRKVSSDMNKNFEIVWKHFLKPDTKLNFLFFYNGELLASHKYQKEINYEHKA